MQKWTVTREESGQRLDKYLRRRLPLAPGSFFYKMLRKKNITLRGKKADGSERVDAGDTVELFLSDDTIRGFSGGGPEEGSRTDEEALEAYRLLQPKMGEGAVLYEDADILIVRKPAGVLSQKAQPGDVSVNEWLRGYLQEQGSLSAVYRPSVCNRLDRNTGGILLCAKTLQGSRALTQIIRDRILRKTYRMVVHGQIREPGRIEGDLVKDRSRNMVRVAEEDIHRDRSENMVRVAEEDVRVRGADPAGETEEAGSGKSSTSQENHLKKKTDRGGVRRHAVTVYRPVRTGSKATLVEADLITGRSHQLRVHLASIGHPIVGDIRYGTGKQDRVKGQLLWCTQITFPSVADCPQMEEVLSPLAGRTFACPAPGWWEKYYRN
ncbi:MAG: RluA family pseudouridine synthase [Eubacteriales bacterium]|nr:RluA family pseudouridine synthase [Eubacteriales bacterium]